MQFIITRKTCLQGLLESDKKIGGDGALFRIIKIQFGQKCHTLCGF